MKNKLGLIFVTVFIFSLTFVSAASPVTEVSYYPEGYTIREQQHHIFEYSKPLRYGFFLTNTTDGKRVNDSDINFCRIVISNSQGFNTKVHEVTYNDTYMLWGVELNQSQVLETFPETGFYNYGVSCQDGKGDVISGIFQVTPNGDSSTNNIVFYLIIIFLGYGLNLLGFFNRNTYITILGGIILIFVGLFMIQNGVIIFRDNLTLALSYITLFWGAGSALWAAIEEIEENF